jgi:hypothetical protein
VALGILRRAVRKQDSDAALEILYGHLEYVDWITEHCAFEAADYLHFSTFQQKITALAVS